MFNPFRCSYMSHCMILKIKNVLTYYSVELAILFSFKLNYGSYS